MNAPTTPYLKTMVECLAKMSGDGYKDEYTIKDNQLHSLKTGHSYKTEEVKIVDFFRFEGQTDPDDDSILYVIETSDGSKGTLIDGYGPSSDTDISGFITSVGNIQKKPNLT